MKQLTKRTFKSMRGPVLIRKPNRKECTRWDHRISHTGKTSQCMRVLRRTFINSITQMKQYRICSSLNWMGLSWGNRISSLAVIRTISRVKISLAKQERLKEIKWSQAHWGAALLWERVIFRLDPTPRVNLIYFNMKLLTVLKWLQ